MLHNDLIKIKNAYQVNHKEVTIPYSRLTHAVLTVLTKKGYIGKVKITPKKPLRDLTVELLYTEGVPHLHEVRFFSKPGRKIYARQSQLHKVRQGYGDIVVSTSKGVMNAQEAKKKGIGGEVICEVF